MPCKRLVEYNNRQYIHQYSMGGIELCTYTRNDLASLWANQSEDRFGIDVPQPV